MIYHNGGQSFVIWDNQNTKPKKYLQTPFQLLSDTNGRKTLFYRNFSASVLPLLASWMRLTSN